MELKITTNHVLKALHVLSWIIFIGLCIESGGILFNSFFTLLIQPLAAQKFWGDLNLANLFDFDINYFITITLLMTIVSILKAILFYLIVKILYDKKLNLLHPFNAETQRFIQKIAYLSLGIGSAAISGVNYTNWLFLQGISMPDIQSMKFGGADVWLFMGIILLVIAQIFKRGIEIQAENELTI